MNKYGVPWWTPIIPRKNKYHCFPLIGEVSFPNSQIIYSSGGPMGWMLCWTLNVVIEGEIMSNNCSRKQMCGEPSYGRLKLKSHEVLCSSSSMRRGWKIPVYSSYEVLCSSSSMQRGWKVPAYSSYEGQVVFQNPRPKMVCLGQVPQL